MKKAYVIYCPQIRGYWAGKAYNEFKGELYAMKFEEEYFPTKRHLEVHTQFQAALDIAKDNFIEIKEVYYK